MLLNYTVTQKKFFESRDQIMFTTCFWVALKNHYKNCLVACNLAHLVHAWKGAFQGAQRGGELALHHYADDWAIAIRYTLMETTEITLIEDLDIIGLPKTKRMRENHFCLGRRTALTTELRCQLQFHLETGLLKTTPTIFLNQFAILYYHHLENSFFQQDVARSHPTNITRFLRDTQVLLWSAIEHIWDMIEDWVNVLI